MKIAFLTAGGIAPCLSSSIGYLIERYNIQDHLHEHTYPSHMKQLHKIEKKTCMLSKQIVC